MGRKSFFFFFFLSQLLSSISFCFMVVNSPFIFMGYEWKFHKKNLQGRSSSLVIFFVYYFFLKYNYFKVFFSILIFIIKKILLNKIHKQTFYLIISN